MPVNHAQLRRFTLMGMLLPTPSAPPGQIATNQRSHEDAYTCICQQPVGLVQLYSQQRLAEEAVHMSLVLHELRWFPIRRRITYTFVCIVHIDCLEHKGDMSSFHNFTGDAKETFELVL